MEELMDGPAFQALNPRVGGCSISPAFIHRGRRSHHHLDSASYRTLVRIFSLCLEFNDDSPQQEAHSDRNPTSFDASPEALESNSCERGATLDGNPGGIVTEELRDGISGRMEVLSCANLRLDAHSDGNGCLELGNEQKQTGDAKDGILSRAKLAGHGDEGANHYSDQKSADEPPSETIIERPGYDPVQEELLRTYEGLLSELVSCEPEKRVPASENEISDLADESKQRENHELQNETAMGTSKVSIAENDKSVVHLSGKSSCSSDKLPLDRMGEGQNKDFCSGLSRTTSPDELRTVEIRDENSNLASESSESMRQDEFFNFEINGSKGSLNYENIEDIEEGQIPDDFLSSDHSLQPVDGNVHLGDKKLEEGLPYGGSLYGNSFRKEISIISSIDPSSMNCSDEHVSSRGSYCKEDESVMLNQNCKESDRLFSWDNRHLKTDIEQNCSIEATKNVKCQTLAMSTVGLPGVQLVSKNEPLIVEAEVRGKRKRTLTEERKAKKKIAKKRKRAQKEREQGVKRLKLQPIVKPKVVQYCNFYLKGRCQQGDLCKFSHDTTPLTKSQPCKYFASDSCLKGDDCPYDHNLSNYPCHNILLKGSCHRGDGCKFSHKMPTTESSSQDAPINLVSPLTSEKLAMRKQKGTKNTSSLASVPPETTTPSTQISMHKHSTGNSVKSPKEPRRIPTGIRFLSFQSEPSVIFRQDDLLLKNNLGVENNNQPNQDKSIMDRNKVTSSLTNKPFLTANNSSEMVPSSRNLQNKVSDASKILEEFLFGGSN